MNILLIGQLTLHWGRLEFGNMGNYYIIEPFVREIHRAFPNAVIKTTFQMTKEFCEREKIEILPMELYYGYRDNELVLAKEELDNAEKLAGDSKTRILSPYIEEVLKSDIILDLSGDMWGDNADIAGKDRFEVGLIKDLIAQALNKPIFMLAGSPGPFDMTANKLELARKVFNGFSLVTNREPISIEVLKHNGFSVDNVRNYACPSFLFEPDRNEDLIKEIKSQFVDSQKPVVGVILCGWNFEEIPFSKWPREDEEYEIFAETLTKFCEYVDVNICLLSHSNGFPVPPAKFELQHGRDYQIIKQLYNILQTKKCRDRVVLVEKVCNVWQTKGIIGDLDMLVSGRVHGAVAGISQCIPTVIIDYGQEPKAHKIHGFAKLADMEEYVANPGSHEDMLNKMLSCWNNRYDIKKELQEKIPQVQKMARKNIEAVKEFWDERENTQNCRR